MKPRRYLFFLMIIPILMLNGCIIKMYEDYQDSHKKETTTVTEETTTERERLEGEVFGIVTKVDLENKVVTIRDIETNALVAYFYSGSTDVRDKYGEIMSMSIVKSGDIVEGKFFIDNNCLSTLYASSRAWSNLRVHNWSYDKNNNRLRVGTQTYALYDFCVITQDGNNIDIRELASIDELIIRGYDKTIYSIDVLKGHGYISLENDGFFIGGIVTVGNEVGLEITKDMLIMASEGKHILSVTKNGVGGAIEVNVKRGKEIVVDIGTLSGEAVIYGSVYFTIKPNNAKLFVNGKEYNHDDLVELPFGTYKVAVEAEGYVPYMGEIVVGETFMKRAISLGFEEQQITGPKEETTTAKENTTEETTGSNSETGGDVTGETSVTYTGEKDISKYKIYIESPVGAEVYLDSERMGTAPISLPKKSGLHTIIFKRDGYEMKAYVMEISAEACDEYFSFLPLEKTEER